MEKIILESIIDKYHLDGIIENAKWIIDNQIISIKSISPNKNLVTNVEAPLSLDDKEFVVYGTSRLLKLIAITDKDIDIDFQNNQRVVTKMLISDSEYDLEYVLADNLLAPIIPTITEPNYEIKFDIDLNLINKFIKAKKSVDTTICSVEPTQNNSLKFIIGETNEYSDKIRFEHPAIYDVLVIKKLLFPIEELKSIFQNNKCIGKGSISLDGVIKLEFEENNIKSTYFLIAN